MDLLLAPAHGVNDVVPLDHPYARSIAVTRMLLYDCVDSANAAAIWPQVLLIAAAINPYLSAARVDPLWKALGTSKCLRKLPSEYAVWLRLFRAVGARDGATSAREAESLLRTKKRPPAEIEYLALVAATGYLASGESEAARRVLEATADGFSPDHRHLPWFVLLRDLAGA